MTAGESPAGPGRGVRRAPREVDEEDRPGDPVCLLRRVCPACGAVAGTDPPTTCPSCHREIPAD